MSHIKNTVIGGLVFLVPFIIIVLLLGEIFDLMLLIADPIGDMMTLEGLAEVTITNILAVLLVLIVCYLAGLLAKSALMQRVFAALDRRLDLLIPGYGYFRSIFRDFDPRATAALKPVIVQLKGLRQFGFLVEDVDDLDCIVFIPIAPDSRSGNVVVVEQSLVTELDSGFIGVVDVLNRLGSGAGKILKKPQE